MSRNDNHEPRWPAFVAMLAAAFLYLSLPEPLSLGPSWLLLAIIFVLLIPITATYRRGLHNVTRSLTFIANGVITVALVASLVFLIQGLPQHLESPKVPCCDPPPRFGSPTSWLFALWYVESILDAGGPLERERRRGRLESSFLFPQMAVQNGADPTWSPHFMDYLFLAFNTSTAFSPTDTAPLSRWAKVGMMLQALISLTILALLAARAVNIL